MKYFEKLAKEDKGYTGAVIGGTIGGGVLALHTKGRKEQIAENLKHQYKGRRVPSKMPGAAKLNKITRTALRTGARGALGLAVGSAAAVGAGIGHLLD